VQVSAEAGAVNTPLSRTDPHVVLQLTGWLALKAFVLSACSETALGVIEIGDVMLMFVEALCPLPSVALAAIVQDSATSGAVNKPPVETLPQSVAKVVAALAVNCWVAPSFTDGFKGLMENDDEDDVIVTDPNPEYCGDPSATALIEQLDPPETVAVNSPFVSIDPHEALQDAGALAVNCCIWPWGNVAVDGVIVTGEIIFALVLALPPPDVDVAVTVHDSGSSGEV
jgi:hypothetical protein